jgi:O-antigen/teichoic acid export membrane protein
MVSQTKHNLYGQPIASAIRADTVAATGNAITKNLQRLLRRAISLLSRDHILSLADQAIVSGTGFLTTFLIARWSGSSQLGIYSLGLSVLLSIVGFQESLILQPYLIQRHYPEGTNAERAGASLTLGTLFAAGSIFVLTVAALGFSEWPAGPEMVPMIWAVAGIVPFALTRDFARRFCFAHLHTGRVVVLDLAAAIIQLSALGWLATSGRMSALSACAALGVAYAFPTIIWLYYARAEFTIRMPHVRITLRQTWALGKWLLAGRITTQVQGYITYWLAAAIAGAAVTGAYAACMSIVNFANPLMIGLTNVVMPRSVLAWKHGGGPGLWHEAIRNTALIGVVMTVFSLAVFFGGAPVMRLLFHGKEFEGHGPTLVVLALATSAGALGTAASIALATMERPRAIIIVTTFEAVLTISLVWVWMTKWGLLGGAYGMLAGNVAGTVGRWIAFYLRVPKVCDSTPVLRVLQEFTHCADSHPWTVTRVGGNDDAEAFLINSTDHQPIWDTYNAVVIKLFKSGALSLSAQMDLHKVLDGHEINGWRISVPRPLYVCRSPLALVMTAVPGQSVSSYTSTSGALTSKIFLDAAYAFAMTMGLYWSSGRRHGDLNFGNVLFDIEAKKISLIDAGSRGDCRVCDDFTKCRSAAASDLAHMLWEAAHDVMDLVRGKTGRISNEMFIERVLLTVIDRIDSLEEKRQLLNEIWSCAQLHLADKLELRWSFQGAWNSFVTQVARRRIRSILERVSSHPKISIEASGQEFPARRAVQSITSC